MKKSTIGGVIGPVVFTIVVFISASSRPDYSHLHNFISELGATGAANSTLMNYAGFVLGGLLIASLGIALINILPRDRVTVFASVLVALFGLGVAMSGLISCDLGCPQDTGTAENRLHNTIAPIAFLCMIVASICFGIRWRKNSRLRKLSSYSIATGVVALGFLGALASSLDTRELTGLWQRSLLFVLFLWCILVSLYTAYLPAKEAPASEGPEPDA